MARAQRRCTTSVRRYAFLICGAYRAHATGPFICELEVPAMAAFAEETLNWARSPLVIDCLRNILDDPLAPSHIRAYLPSRQDLSVGHVIGLSRLLHKTREAAGPSSGDASLRTRVRPCAYGSTTCSVEPRASCHGRPWSARTRPSACLSGSSRRSMATKGAPRLVSLHSLARLFCRSSYLLFPQTRVRRDK